MRILVILLRHQTPYSDDNKLICCAVSQTVHLWNQIANVLLGEEFLSLQPTDSANALKTRSFSRTTKTQPTRYHMSQDNADDTLNSPAISIFCSGVKIDSILRTSASIWRWLARNWSFAICHVRFRLVWSSLSWSSNWQTVHKYSHYTHYQPPAAFVQPFFFSQLTPDSAEVTKNEVFATTRTDLQVGCHLYGATNSVKALEENTVIEQLHHWSLCYDATNKVQPTSTQLNRFLIITTALLTRQAQDILVANKLLEG